MSLETETALRREAAWFAQTMPNATEVRIRVATFRPEVERRYQCPRCWIRSGIRSSLRSLPGTDEHDILKCNSPRCGAEFVIPF